MAILRLKIVYVNRESPAGTHGRDDQMTNFPHFPRLQEPNCTAKAKRPRIVFRHLSPRI